MAVFDARERLIPQVIRARREQLSLTGEEVAARAKRKRLKAAQLDSVEQGEGWLDVREYAYLEDALELPAGFLWDGLLNILASAEVLSEVEPEHVLEQISAEESVGERGGRALVACPGCFQRLKWLVKRYRIDATVSRTRDAQCLCERAGLGSGDPELLLRLAVRLSGVSDVLVLGGGQDVSNAAASISFASVRVVRDDEGTSQSVRVPDQHGIVVVARGEISHAMSDRYMKALNSMPVESRPVVLHPNSSNLTAIAEEIIHSTSDD